MAPDRSTSSVHRLSTLRERVAGGVDRRELLRMLVGAGYALGMAHLLGVEEFLSVDDGEVPVVTALVRRDPDDPFSIEPRTKAVPAAWYAAVTRAFEVNELVARSRVTGLLASAVVPGDYREQTAAISANVSPNASGVRRALEGLIDGDLVSIETIDGLRVGDLEPFRPDSRDTTALTPRYVADIETGAVPGGVACETITSQATLSPAIYHPDEERAFFTTAAHAFADPADTSGSSVYLPLESRSSITLGHGYRGHPVEDLVLIEPTGRVRPDDVIDAPAPIRVGGQLTRFGLADLVAREEPIEKVGAMSGHTQGHIQGIDAITCFTDRFCRPSQLRWGSETDLTDGDSGSVSYYVDPESERALIAGFNNARTWWPGQSYIWGVAAYHVHEQFGYHF